MQKFYKPSRVAVIFVIMALLLALFMSTLYKLQLYDTGADENAWLAYGKTTDRTIVLTADRGDILDRNGVPLVSTRPAYYITLNRDTLLDRDDINQIILDLVHLAIDNDVDYIDTFPVTIGAPFAYLYDMTDSQRDNLLAYLKFVKNFGIEGDITASDLIVKMKERYGIDYTTNISDARLIIGIRYEMEMRHVKSMNPYVFADDVSIDVLTLIKTNLFPGVNIETGAKRVYLTSYAAHLLGYTGKMSSDEYNNIYKPLGYEYNAVVGKDGAEKSFESYLHGSDGEQEITTSDDGTVMDVVTTKEPVPGENVFLSIDIGLQAACEEALAAKISVLNADPERTEEEDKVTGGAVVVVDVNTGEVLASASYPTYDLANLSRNYTDLLNNKNLPLLNRATQGIYLPGSTFKMVTALAGLVNGIITPLSTVYCNGIYTEYADVGFTRRCWIYDQSGIGHGDENVVTALRDSCNVFFYELGDKLDVNGINPTAREFGFGSKTGIELQESAGILADRVWKQDNMPNDTGWWAGDSIQTAIGQAYSRYTPIQLANYVATIANGGTHYSLTMLNNIRSADFTSIVYEPEPKVLNTVSGSEWIPYLQEGMKLVATDGTARGVFKDYPIPVAAKTGTVQTGITMGKANLNNGVFVCYAPADNPEIAISVVVEKGTSGSAIMEIAKVIMDYYFHETVAPGAPADNTIMP
jgi:penicillin-binding protein 2